MNIQYDEGMHFLLKQACVTLALDVGIISLIRDNTYYVAACHSSIGDIPPGSTFSIQDTYCSEVVKTRALVTYLHVGKDPNMNRHPVYQNLHLESYIGVPVLDDEGAVIGTVNFSSQTMKHKEFLDSEKEFVENLAAHPDVQKFLSDLLEKQHS